MASGWHPEWVPRTLTLCGAKQLKPTVNYERGPIHELLRRGLGPYWMS